MVILVVAAVTVLWIRQGAQAIVPVAILTALGIVLGLAQIMIALPPRLRPEVTPVDRYPAVEVPRPEASWSLPAHRLHWGQAPQGAAFYGRREELAKLNRWVCDERCRLVLVQGIGGGAAAVGYGGGGTNCCEVPHRNVGRIGKPVQVRHGPAAVTRELPPTRSTRSHWPFGLGRRAVRRRSGSPKTGLAPLAPNHRGLSAAGACP